MEWWRIKSEMSKTILKLLAPPILIDSIRYINSLWMFLNNRSLLNRNAEVVNKYNSEAVYILANGPSLNNFNIKNIIGAKVITMNFFNLHPLKDELKIVAHCVGDPIDSMDIEKTRLMIKEIKAETYWFNIDVANHIKPSDYSNIHYYLQGVRYNAKMLSGDDLAFISLSYQSTAQMAINVAMYMGFKKIYLLGFDHDWLATRAISTHFYADNEKTQISDLSVYSYTKMIEISLTLFKIYEKILSVSRKKNIEIINISNPTFLDIFRKEQVDG